MSITKKIVVKIGSNVLTLASGLPDKKRMAQLVSQIASLKATGIQVILVSSGAVAAGRSVANNYEHLDTITKRQMLAAVGQTELMHTYRELFQQHNETCAQVLVTKESFRTRQHYLNIKNCLDGLLKSNITPIINENDVVSITELMFTDNDELSGLVAAMLDVESLVLLTNVDGIFTAHPKEPNATLIQDFNATLVDLENAVSDIKSEFGRGGMFSKATTAKKTSELGIDVYIGNGTKDNIVTALLNKETGTYFKANENPVSPVKKWVAHAGDFSKAQIIINDGAKEALMSTKANSLLMVGVIAIKGAFKKGDVVNILDPEQNKIGLGKVTFDSKEANSLIGEKGQQPIIHYNYLVLDSNS